jgi:hypothetical protein
MMIESEPAAAEAGDEPDRRAEATAIETAMSPTVSEMRAPCITRLATSRPSWSLPSA